ncbi:MAG: AraC family transcriptional regulator, partial [Candidatus Puniceispirillaceae bacterium]
MQSGDKEQKINMMLRSSKSAGPLKVGFLLIPNFSMLAFASAIEPLRAANRMSGDTLFSWIVASPDGMQSRASNHVKTEVDGDSTILADCHIVFVCAGLDVKAQSDKSILNMLRRLDRQGAVIGAICTGTYLMAAAGLLDDRRCTIHWENIDGLAEEFPLLEITNELFEIDDTRITCSGGTASLDMILYMIGQIHGQTLAAQVSD